jgi:hypothetical protein
VFRKALLRETNLSKVKRLEKDYFKSLFGGVYDIYTDVDLAPLLRFQSFQLQSMDMLLRYNHANYMQAIQIINEIENNITNALLPRGSFFKLLFLDSLNNWFFLTENLAPLKAGIGPWDLHS